MSKKAVSTIGTVLKAGTDKSSLAQLCKIKSYPDLGGAPEQLETTDLEDCLLYTSPSPRDRTRSRMPSSA